MSEPLHLYAYFMSQPSRSVIFFAKTSGIEYEYHHTAVGSPEITSEEFLKVSPNGTIPAIQHGDYNLWESAAIVPYLADAYGVDNQWYPKNVEIRGRINAYLHWHHQNIREPLHTYNIQVIVAPKFFGGVITPEKEAALKAKFDGALRDLKWLIADTGFVARTQEATIADIFAYSELTACLILGENYLDGHPELKAWSDRIGENPVIVEVFREMREFIAQNFNS